MTSSYVNTHLVGAKQLWNQTCAIYRGGGRERPAGMSGYLPRVGTSSTSSYRYGLSVPSVDGHFGRPISTVAPMSSTAMGSVSQDDSERKPAQGSPDISYNYGSYNTFRTYTYVDDLAYHFHNLDADANLMWMEEFPPSFCTFRDEQWSLLQRYCCPKDTDTIVDVKVALENELVLMCVWCLFIDTDIPTTCGNKENVVRALNNIFEAATNMCNHEESVTRHAPTKMSIDQDYVEALLVDLLCSKNEEVLRQVLHSLGFLHHHKSYYMFSLGNGIQKKLIQLSRDFSCDSPMLTNVLFAINRISIINKGMREKVIEAEFSDGFLRILLTREGAYKSFLQAEAYFMVCNFACGQCNDETWKYLKEHLMSLVIDRCRAYNTYVERAGALAIWMFIAKASPRCIKELFDMGCSENLVCLLSDNDAFVKCHCYEAVETILSLGDDDPGNEYGKMIDGLTNDWESFLVTYPHSLEIELVHKASGIVKRHCPDKHLDWLESQEGLDIW